MIKELILGLIDTYGTNDPFELCDHLEIKIMESNLGNEINGFFQRTENGCEIIHLNSNLNHHNKKSICAHELGHALLHTNLSIGFFIENSLQVKSKYEIQADNFAAELLLPNELDIEFKYMNVNQLSCVFKVPKEFIKYKYCDR
ncbi:Zn peptidase [Clostridium tetani]|uniref:ImmA/IrrE family metallo-endopeptidase n=1 Tax=Clostridium tetani TaxID=1513 RepID=UPI000574B197|nr:ImmA/IrrE family metallo-endopeptidase [Clostridium tetani]KHO39105.1 Zn peptidase [Clostridium tetani]RXM68387.1 ImmA/IrrE family metallo-endopeptidase [Clostridium tetani]BDR67234.1 hypothetical protein K144312032_14620 [Clostridium tetani]